MERPDDDELDRFFEEVYLPTTTDLMSPRLDAMETEVLWQLLAPARQGRVLDLGCGHGRHVAGLRRRGLSGAVGLDRSPAALARARATLPDGVWLRGDYRRLPVRTGGLDACFSWYSGLFLRPEAESGVLAEIRRVLAPGGRFLHDGANPTRLAREPVARLTRRTAAGLQVEEVCRFDAPSGVEHGWRRLRHPDGTVREGRWSVRHPMPEQLVNLLVEAGFDIEAVYDERGRAFDAARSLDVVVVATRRR